MWEGWLKDNTDRDLTWLVEGMKNGIVEWCTDRFYHRTKAPNTRRAGWMWCNTLSKEDGTTRGAMKRDF